MMPHTYYLYMCHKVILFVYVLTHLKKTWKSIPVILSFHEKKTIQLSFSKIPYCCSNCHKSNIKHLIDVARPKLQQNFSYIGER